MGLDMYLTRETYLSQYGDDAPRNRLKVEGVDDLGIVSSRVSTIVEEVCYWRKANAIHGWFVREVQDGVDECEKTLVSREQLTKLLGVVNAVLNRGTFEYAMTALPPVPGFFFGSKEIDEFYWDDLKRTASVLTEVLAEPTADPALGAITWFFYQSSW